MDWAGRMPTWSRLSRSIVLRMTAWYAGSAFLLVLAATGVLYWVLATHMAAEDAHVLRSTAKDLSLLLRGTGRQSVERTNLRSPGRIHRPLMIWVRVLNDHEQTLRATRGMGHYLPPAAFPSAAALKPGKFMFRELRTGSGEVFQTISTRLPAAAGVGDRVLQVALDRTGEERLLARYREWLLLVLTASVLLCAAGGYGIAQAGMRPIRRVTATARHIRSSTLHQRIDVAGLPTELHALAGTFNAMLARLEESFGQVSRFSADVAHELRTPVNNLRGEIEVALGRARSTEDYREVLGSALEECARLSQVIQSLLFLARAETAAERSCLSIVDVHREISAVTEFYDASAAEAGVRLVATGAEGVTAALDRPLFQQAVGNLLANAIAHTPPGGEVRVLVSVHAGRLRVEVADTGHGIAPEHLPRVFDRFYRVDPARSGGTGNVGLGLAVVESIVTLHGGTIRMESTPGEGTRVILDLPLKGAADARAAIEGAKPAT